jgi:hypothetical protein
VPIRDFISLSSPLVAVSLLFFWCAAVKKEIPKNCDSAVANKKLSGSPAVFRAMPTRSAKMTTITAMTTMVRSKNGARLRRLRVEDFYNVRNQQCSAPQLHVHRLPSKPAPCERRRSLQDSIVPSGF